jgi:RNA ligase (TIGR02306 family)
VSTFKVEIRNIDTARKHDNADRLDVCTVKGMLFQFVTLRDQFKSGDKVVYFPLDSVLPDDLIKKLNLEGKLAGKEKNRIKTVRLRGLISQGICSDPSLFGFENRNEFDDVTEELGVTKYDPPIKLTFGGDAYPLPAELSKYDIESCDRFVEEFNILLDSKEEVVVTEKLEGTNYSIIYYPEEDKFDVCFRTCSIKESDNYYWHVTKKQNMIDLIKKASTFSNTKQHIAFRGEIIGPGIQGNIYNLKEIEVRIFDIQKDGNYLDHDDYYKIITEFDIPNPPILYIGLLKDYLNGESIQSKSNGKSALNLCTLREGIVIKPKKNFHSFNIGRMILKQRSPEYLVGSDC